MKTKHELRDEYFEKTLEKINQTEHDYMFKMINLLLINNLKLNEKVIK